MDMRLVWVLGLEADQVKAQMRLSVEKPQPAYLESHVIGLLPVAGAQHKDRQNGRAAEAGQASLGVCLRVGTTAGRARGRVLFAHPWAATSWTEPCLKGLVAIDGMRRVRRAQCQFALTLVDDAGNVGPARKGDRFHDE